MRGGAGSGENGRRCPRWEKIDIDPSTSIWKELDDDESNEERGSEEEVASAPGIAED